MALPTMHRKIVLDSYQAALETVVAGANYRHTLTVTRQPISVEQADVTKCPLVILVGGGHPQGDLMASRKAADSFLVVMQVYIKPDPTRWADASAPELAEEVLADIMYALDRDPSRGTQAQGFAGVRTTRDVDLAHHLEGAYSVLVINDTFEWRRVT